MQDCISAISTPNGTGGVAIIRISGEGALKIARKMFVPAGKITAIQPNYMYAGKIAGEGFTDFGFMVYFAAPKSFTGEDTVEFHCHGGVQIARGILSKTFSLGCRSAERGEFTRPTAASFSIFSLLSSMEEWTYRLRVMDVLAWPRISLKLFNSKPASTHRVAKV